LASFRVAPVSVDIRFMYYVRRVRNLRETRICIIKTCRQNDKNLPITPHSIYYCNIYIPHVVNIY